MLGAWDGHYDNLTEPLAYGRTSYATIAEFVRDCEDVQDWGCGGGALKVFLGEHQRYIGVDGSRTPYADVHADLTRYRSDACAVVLRHVLEHNDDWRDVLDNALASALRKLIIVLFTPTADETTVMFREPDYARVPVIAFRLDDLLDRLSPRVMHEVETVESPDTAFGTETFIRVWR